MEQCLQVRASYTAASDPLASVLSKAMSAMGMVPAAPISPPPAYVPSATGASGLPAQFAAATLPPPAPRPAAPAQGQQAVQPHLPSQAARARGSGAGGGAGVGSGIGSGRAPSRGGGGGFGVGGGPGSCTCSCGGSWAAPIFWKTGLAFFGWAGVGCDGRSGSEVRANPLFLFLKRYECYEGSALHVGVPRAFLLQLRQVSWLSGRRVAGPSGVGER